MVILLLLLLLVCLFVFVVVVGGGVWGMGGVFFSLFFSSVFVCV